MELSPRVSLHTPIHRPLILTSSILKHFHLPSTPFLPTFIPYLTSSTSIPSTSLPPAADASSPLPLAKDPLPADTPTPISFALEFYAEAMVEQGRTGDAEGVFRELGEEVDRMRAGYWEYRRRACAE